ncbi:sulfotransferase [Nocardioides sp. GY 10127]|uniref:sulfotransferase family protein n=1 Tax=Nocardioides sp. GY 10127 TaxID=2569762 RepID=UPI0023EF4EBF|nr:sulfotransferase [Nocardioides sp. GY 10127]
MGAARSGTTGIVNALRAHPDVFMCEPKEPHYFAFHGKSLDFTGPGDEQNMNKRAVVERQKFLSLFDGAPSDVVALGEGSVSSLYYSQESIQEMLEINPEYRAVIVLRDPAERSFSAYQYLKARGFEDASTFREALALEDWRVEANYHHLWHYRRMSLYASDVKAYLEAFGGDRVLILFQEDVEADLGAAMTALCRFLGLREVDLQVSTERVNASGVARSKLIGQTLGGISRVGFVRDLVRRLTSFEFRERVRNRVLRRTSIEPEDRAFLASYFESDLEELGSTFSRYGIARPMWIGRI